VPVPWAYVRIQDLQLRHSLPGCQQHIAKSTSETSTAMGQSHAKAGKSDMTPEEFDQLVRTTAFTKDEVHAFHEKFKQDFPKGYVDKKGFKTVYTSMFPQGSGADKFADHIFRVYDADGNGQISFDEFVTTLNIGTQGTPEEKLKSSFRLYDVDRNGSITQKELTSILAAIYKSRNDPQAAAKAKTDGEKIMFQLDTDKNKKLSEAEFVQAAKSCPAVLQILQGN